MKRKCFQNIILSNYFTLYAYKTTKIDDLLLLNLIIHQVCYYVCISSPSPSPPPKQQQQQQHEQQIIINTIKSFTIYPIFYTHKTYTRVLFNIIHYTVWHTLILYLEWDIHIMKMVRKFSLHTVYKW